MKKQVIAVILLVIAAVSFADTNSSAKNQEDIESQYAAGLALWLSHDYEEVFKCFKRLAEQGHAGAQYSLGMRYYLGEGTLTDKKKAFYWFTQAAEQGLADAQHNLGILYYLGEGTLTDKKKAFYWFTQAAEQGDAQAQYKLGILYYVGEGTSADMKQAACWIKKAYENGFENAKDFWEEKELWQYEE